MLIQAQNEIPVSWVYGEWDSRYAESTQNFYRVFRYSGPFCKKSYIKNTTKMQKQPKPKILMRLYFCRGEGQQRRQVEQTTCRPFIQSQSLKQTKLKYKTFVFRTCHYYFFIWRQIRYMYLHIFLFPENFYFHWVLSATTEESANEIVTVCAFNVFVPLTCLHLVKALNNYVSTFYNCHFNT